MSTGCSLSPDPPASAREMVGLTLDPTEIRREREAPMCCMDTDAGLTLQPVSPYAGDVRTPICTSELAVE